MKNILFTAFLIVSFAGCRQTKKDSDRPKENDPKQPQATQKGNSLSVSENPIIGEWYQQFAVLDQNSNASLDPEERNGIKSNMGFNYFQFKEDGTCLYDSDMKFKGRFEILEENGKKKLQVTVNGFGETYKYIIRDPVDDELVLFSSGAFMIFRRK